MNALLWNIAVHQKKQMESPQFLKELDKFLLENESRCHVHISRQELLHLRSSRGEWGFTRSDQWDHWVNLYELWIDLITDLDNTGKIFLFDRDLEEYRQDFPNVEFYTHVNRLKPSLSEEPVVKMLRFTEGGIR